MPSDREVEAAAKRAMQAFRTYADSLSGEYASRYEVARDLRIQADVLERALTAAEAVRADPATPRP